MAAQKRPKVLLFDIGGVCVASPFQAILDYELSLGIPPGWVNYSISKTAPDGTWHRLERGEIPADSDFLAGFNRDLYHPVRWDAFYRIQHEKSPLEFPTPVPPVPVIDGERLFNEMMQASKHPDPWMFPALKKLKASGKHILAALSNTVIFPRGHRLFTETLLDDPVCGLFDIFISSAHVGLRKPDPNIYQLALKTVQDYAKEHAAEGRGRELGWDAGVQAGDILFLDDIGENLKSARSQGFRTVRVFLGRTFEAVDELERVTGLKLAGSHPRILVKPNTNWSKAKI